MLKQILVFFVFTFTLYSSELNIYKDFEDVKGAKSFVLVVEDYCPWCKKFKKDVMSDKEVITALNSFKSAVLMKNEWNKEGIGHVRFVPTIFFLDKDKKILARNDGYMNKEEFLKLINSLQ